MEKVRHADADPAKRRRAPQARTAEEIDSSAGLSQMSAQLRKNGIEPPSNTDHRSTIVLARRVKRRLCGKAWYGHPTAPTFDFSERGRAPNKSDFVSKAE
jgi:hypothetical protein